MTRATTLRLILGCKEFVSYILFVFVIYHIFKCFKMMAYRRGGGEKEGGEGEARERRGRGEGEARRVAKVSFFNLQLHKEQQTKIFPSLPPISFSSSGALLLKFYSSQKNKYNKQK